MSFKAQVQLTRYGPFGELSFKSIWVGPFEFKVHEWRSLKVLSHKVTFWLCQVIPFPPEDTGMIFQPDPANPITLVSDYTVYNPKLPLTMAFPEDFCGDNGNIMMIVGIVPKVNWWK